MNLIDSTYFTGEIALPSVKEDTSLSGPDAILAKGGNRELNGMIEKYQKKFLHSLLGKPLTGAFIAGLQETPIPDKWQALKDKLCAVGEFHKESPIAYYVYSYALPHLRNSTTQKGVKKAKATYASNSSDWRLLIESWNRMCDLNEELLAWLYENEAVYGEYLENHKFARDLINYKNWVNI
jgi:hypothetical protein